MNIYTKIPNCAESVITIGSFDGVHLGHQALIAKTELLANEKKVQPFIITFDQHPRLIVGNDHSFKILTTLEEKLNRFELLGVQNVLIIPFDYSFSRLTAVDFLEKYIVYNLHPSTILIGYDHKFGHDRKGSIDTISWLNQKNNTFIKAIEFEEITMNNIKLSSSIIRKEIISGNMNVANSMLNYNYTIQGTVIKGKQLGRTIGFPTANILPNQVNKLIPKIGVYYTKVLINHRIYHGATNIGFNPSIALGNPLSIETYILDFDQDIYNCEIQLQFIEYIREELKFNSLETLQAKIKEDVDYIKSILI